MTPEQARVIALAEPFTTILRELFAAIVPLMHSLAVAPRRHRSRVLTRRKQRSNW